MHYIIGIDEVGRGPLAGPLCVGACLVTVRDKRRVFAMLSGVRDSKQLSPEARLEWLARMRPEVSRGRVRIATSFVGGSVIDRLGMARALRLGVRRVLARFAVAPDDALVLLDGSLYAPREYRFQETLIGGDETEPLIALASIAAKVRRDRYMTRLAARFPAYGFAKHKGYGTGEHYRALREHGACEIHRRSFLQEFQITSSKLQTISNIQIPITKTNSV